jgi:hypothetical protein
VGIEFRDAVKTGAVAVTSAGSLATGAKIGIPDNNFHGDAHPRR